MIKADITMKDGTKLLDVMLFTHKEMGDSQVSTKDEAIELLSGDDGIVFFGGKYVQGWLISSQISTYKVYEDDKDFEDRIHKFIENTKTIYDKTDIANFIIDYREDLLKIIK